MRRREEIARIAMNRDTGARRLRSVVNANEGTVGITGDASVGDREGPMILAVK
jgi:hypothetical protein